MADVSKRWRTGWKVLAAIGLLAVVASLAWESRWVAQLRFSGRPYVPWINRDFTRLPQLLSSEPATLAKVHEGLPHPFGEQLEFLDRLWNSTNRSIRGYRFYDPPIPVHKELEATLVDVLTSTNSFIPYGGPKLCGGFHADFAVEMVQAGKSVRFLVCLGCAEVLLFANGKSLICDLSGKACQKLRRTWWQRDRLDDAVFPVQVSGNRLHLEDLLGRPFLYHADTPWGLVTRLRREEVELYLDHRRAAGFNAVQVQLIPEAAITSGTNAYGHGPFRTPGDFSTPDPRYFDHAAWVVEQAGKRGMLVAFNPVWLGCCDGGRRDLMASNGVDRCRELGRFLGNRFRGYANLLWIQGGDRDPGKWRPFVDAVAEGIDETAPNQLQTAHWSSTHSSLDEIGDARWLDLNATYTYAAEHVGAWRRQFHVYHSARRDAERVPRMPFFLIESTYEGEHGATAQKIRRQAWWAVLSGACGQAMGNGQIWGFREGWQERLDTPAVRDLGVLRRVLETHRWWTLRPDFGHRVLTSGFGTENRGDQPGGDDFVTLAVADDGTALAYLPEGGIVGIAAHASARRVEWVDPTTGATPARIRVSAGSSLRSSPPGLNAGGDRDWVLSIRPE